MIIINCKFENTDSYFSKITIIFINSFQHVKFIECIVNCCYCALVGW